MKPVFQTVIDHNPSEGRIGDCFRACLASLLELPIDDVPAPEAYDNAAAWWRVYRDWLRARGLAILTHTEDEAIWRDWFVRTQGDVYHIASGPSPRHPGTDHSVVMRNDVMVHDPHPSGVGLAKITCREFLIARCA